MEPQQLSSQVIQALSEVAPEADTSTLDPEVNFRDQIEIDSVDFLNFIVALERRLEVKIPELDYPKLSSLQGCMRYLSATL